MIWCSKHIQEQAVELLTVHLEFLAWSLNNLSAGGVARCHHLNLPYFLVISRDVFWVGDTPTVAPPSLNSSLKLCVCSWLTSAQAVIRFVVGSSWMKTNKTKPNKCKSNSNTCFDHQLVDQTGKPWYFFTDDHQLHPPDVHQLFSRSKLFWSTLQDPSSST